MIYLYFCPKCNHNQEVIKPAMYSGRTEYCGKCHTALKRVYTVPQVSVPNIEPGFNYGLGCEVRNKRDIQDRVKELADGKVRGRDKFVKDENGREYVEKIDIPGREVVEVGNEKVKPAPPKRHSYEIPREMIGKVWKE